MGHRDVHLILSVSKAALGLGILECKLELCGTSTQATAVSCMEGSGLAAVCRRLGSAVELVGSVESRWCSFLSVMPGQ